MKKKKNTRNLFIFIAIVTILVSSCTYEDTAVDDSDINEEAAMRDIENAADPIEIVEDSTIEEGEESGESAAEETENTEFKYHMNGDFIVNYNEVFAENKIFLDLRVTINEPFDVPDYVVREEDIIGEFCEGFPEELQQLLVYKNDSIHGSPPEAADIVRLYTIDGERISGYMTSDFPLDQLGEGIGNHSLIATDIDSDGEEEYIFFRYVRGAGGAAYRQMIIMEYNDAYGWNIIGYGTAPYEAAVAYLLEYEGTKYILLGKLLVCWNEEYDETTSDYSEKPWNVMAANRELAGYTLNEIYSREGDDTDYLAGIDLENPRNNAERDYSERAYSFTDWDCGDWTMRRDFDWEREYDGKTYLYVASNFNRTFWPQCDLLVTIFEEGEDCMEAVKVYYLAGHYRLSLDHEECGVDGSW